MKNSLAIRNLIVSTFMTVSLLGILVKTPSPKIILVPFLICSISMMGKSIAMLFNRERLGAIFSKIFALGFFLFWFGFLGFGAFVSVRDKNYSMLIYLIPFLIAGIFFARRKLFNKTPRQKEGSSFNFAIIISAFLVLTVLVSGIFLIFLGIKRAEIGILLFGAFFAFGGFTFVLAALTIKGCFDKWKIDVLGMYVGVLFVLIGGGIVSYLVFFSNDPIQLWIIIPILMAAAGVAKIVSCLKEWKRIL